MNFKKIADASFNDIKFSGYLISRVGKKTFCEHLISWFGDCKNISRVFHFKISIKLKNEISLILFFLLLINVIVIKYVAETLNSSLHTVDTGRKLNVHKTSRRPPGRCLNVLCTFNLRPVPTGLVDICDMSASISYFDQILGKR